MPPESDRKVTGFRISKRLLRDFQRYLGDQEMDMSPVLESWVASFMALNESDRAQWLSGVMPTGSAPTLTSERIDPEKFAGAQLTLPDRQSIELSVEEWRWVGRVLEIVHGGRPEAMRPLASILDAFVVLTNLLNRGSGATSPGDRVPGASPKNLAGALELLRDTQSAARASLEDAQRAAEDLRAAKRGVRGRGGRDKSGGTGGG